jgi:hypothetical protein
LILFVLPTLFATVTQHKDRTPLTINLEGMVKDVPSAKNRLLREVQQMQRFVETLPPGGVNSFTSKTLEVGYDTQVESRNWYFAIGGYSTWGKGSSRDCGDSPETCVGFQGVAAAGTWEGTYVLVVPTDVAFGAFTSIGHYSLTAP